MKEALASAEAQLQGRSSAVVSAGVAAAAKRQELEALDAALAARSSELAALERRLVEVGKGEYRAARRQLLSEGEHAWGWGKQAHADAACCH